MKLPLATRHAFALERSCSSSQYQVKCACMKVESSRPKFKLLPWYRTLCSDHLRSIRKNPIRQVVLDCGISHLFAYCGSYRSFSALLTSAGSTDFSSRPTQAPLRDIVDVDDGRGRSCGIGTRCSRVLLDPSLAIPHLGLLQAGLALIVGRRVDQLPADGLERHTAQQQLSRSP